MKDSLPWFVTIAAIFLCFYLLSEQSKDMDRERTDMIAMEDSLRNEARLWQDSAAYHRANADTLARLLDSARMVYPPAPVIIRRSLKMMEFAPLKVAIDTLSAE